MLNLTNGHCGLCKHFSDEPHKPRLVQIRTSKTAPEDLTEECFHPTLGALNLQVTPGSGCAGFEAAA